MSERARPAAQGGSMMHPSSFESLTGEVDLEFPEYDVPPPEPIALVRGWIAAAERRGVREPRALALATATADGRSSNRIVTLSMVDDRGLLFASHATSRKGRELAATRWASGVLYWRETGQQVIVSGAVAPVDARESDALWFARPLPMHVMSTLSWQSDPLADPDALRVEAEKLATRAAPFPRPSRFVGYRLTPHEVELWCASSDRLHRRLHYELDGGGWRVRRLQP